MVTGQLVGEPIRDDRPILPVIGQNDLGDQDDQDQHGDEEYGHADREVGERLSPVVVRRPGRRHAHATTNHTPSVTIDRATTYLTPDAMFASRMYPQTRPERMAWRVTAWKNSIDSRLRSILIPN